LKLISTDTSETIRYCHVTTDRQWVTYGQSSRVIADDLM